MRWKIVIIVLVGLALVVLGIIVLVKPSETDIQLLEHKVGLRGPVLFLEVNPSGVISRGLAEEWYISCGDNLSVIWDANKSVSLPNLILNRTDYLTGGYAPSVHTYDAFPNCVNLKDMNNYVNMTCLLKTCNKLIQYNVLNGTNKTIWSKGQIW